MSAHISVPYVNTTTETLWYMRQEDTVQLPECCPVESDSMIEFFLENRPKELNRFSLAKTLWSHYNSFIFYIHLKKKKFLLTKYRTENIKHLINIQNTIVSKANGVGAVIFNLNFGAPETWLIWWRHTLLVILSMRSGFQCEEVFYVDILFICGCAFVLG